jgi:hypothetical protein
MGAGSLGEAFAGRPPCGRRESDAGFRGSEAVTDGISLA